VACGLGPCWLGGGVAEYADSCILIDDWEGVEL
jgi:hypothetical protein